MERLRLGQQSSPWQCVVACELNDPPRREFPGSTEQLLNHIRIVSAEVLRIAGVSDQNRTSLSAAGRSGMILMGAGGGASVRFSKVPHIVSA